jgi:hypothetical protein
VLWRSAILSESFLKNLTHLLFWSFFSGSNTLREETLFFRDHLVSCQFVGVWK